MKVRMLREAGGLGDVVCTLPILQWMHEEYVVGQGAQLYIYGFTPYKPIWDMSGIPYAWRNQHHNGVRRRRRWVDPCQHYKEHTDEFAMHADLWCPAWPHETAKQEGYPIWSRIECFAHAAGMPFDRIQCPHITVPESAMSWARQYLRFAGHGDEHLVLMFPLAAGPARCWGYDRFAAVARALWQRDRARVIVLAGKPSDLRWWQENAPEFATPRCVLSFDRLAALMNLADLVVSGDTGPFHLAAAVNTPSLGLFGMTGGELTSKHYPLASWIQGTRERPGGCRVPCYHRFHDGFEQRCKPRGCAALLSITPDQVIDRASILLKEKTHEQIAQVV